ncbi:N-6 DNA methylase [Kaistella sp.]|uniref:N-6 DNA methylase n=1 Tax=Kaistella sp. TaxID=2782235 RepID=UPI002F941B19
MLDTQTKRRIDDCRDILVGKLPDPKAQIEQITIGLIYKFMDDMDKEAVELGGQAKFFSDYKVPDPEFPNDRNKDKVIEFSKYAWDKLMHPKVTATEMLTLYSEAIEGMEKNPNIPQLFRDIFNNAYLPYRDPETLKLFLKTIGEFEYTHSEKLGDAFEYLLSVMGSQGDAGQFRTPRHIIDFLVAIIDPDKTDTILDPACGTAGFLISAYKHILLKHSKDNKQGLNIYEYNKLEKKPFNNLGDQLTPDDRKKLIQNFVGYDISPDMVRLSLVNLYLHGFNTPNIHEYDTLSSEERWNENFDVVLANPPFMSPKGGIRPHKKFTISSNRSEVLFVDYIAEHLNPNGKAGIIVPEGIIFQSGTAYKDLRKMLVENHLYAVVSLPAGVFNPYSGVKTSILLMDKEVAKNREEILFIKIDNDGYNLGAQRTAVKGGQLEEAIKLAHRFVETGEFEETSIAHLVTKAELSKNGDFNLSGDRYKTQAVSNSNFELVPIEDLFETIRNGRNVEQFDEVGKYRVTRIQTISDGTVDLEKTKWTNDEVPEDYFMEEGDILLSHINSIEHLAKSAIFTGINEKVVHGTNLIRFKPNKSKVKPEFIASIFKSQKFIDTAKTFAQKAVNQASLRVGDLKSIQIPLPPLSIQEEIVAEIEGYQKIIDGAKAVVANYKPKIDIDPEWEILQMSEIANVNPESKDPSSLYSDWFTYIDISSVENGSGIIDYSNKVNTADAPSRARRVVQKNDILLSTVRPNLKAFGFVDLEPERFIASTGFALLRTNQKCLPKYLYYLVFQDFMLNQMVGSMEKGAYPSINQNDVNNLKVPVAPLETQQQIVAQIEKEQELVNSNKELIEIFEQKIKDRISKVWGE